MSFSNKGVPQKNSRYGMDLNNKKTQVSHEKTKGAQLIVAGAIMSMKCLAVVHDLFF